MANPILDGIRTGASLVNQSAQTNQQRWRDVVSADQFDRKLGLSQDMHDEDKRIQARGENLQLGQATYAKAYELNRMAREALDDTPEGKKKFNQLRRERNAVVSQGMRENKEFRKWMKAVGYAAGSPSSVTTSVDGKGHFTDVQDVEAKADTVDSQGNPVKKGDPGNVIGGMGADGKPTVLAEGRQPGGAPQFISEFDMDAVFGRDSNEYWKSGSVGLAQTDNRADRISKELQDLSQPHLQAQANLRETQTNLAGFDRNNPDLFTRPENKQAEKKNLAGAPVDPVLSRLSKPELDALQSDYDHQRSYQTKGVKVRTDNIPSMMDSAISLFKSGAPGGEAAMQEQTEYISKELDTIERRSLAGEFNKGMREAASYHKSMLLEQKRKMELAQGQKPSANEGKSALKEADIDTPKKLNGALLSERKALETAVLKAQTAAEKATLSMKHAHIAGLMKLGITPSAKDVTNIMNNGGASYAELARSHYNTQRLNQMSGKQRQQYIDDRRKRVSSKLDNLVSELPSKDRENHPLVKFRQAIGASGVMDNPHVLFDVDDVDRLHPYYTEMASYAGYNDFPPLDIAQVNMAMQGRGLKDEKSDEEWGEFVLNYASQIDGIARQAGGTGFEVMSSIDATMDDLTAANGGDAEAALSQAIQQFQARLQQGG